MPPLKMRPVRMSCHKQLNVNGTLFLADLYMVTTAGYQPVKLAFFMTFHVLEIMNMKWNVCFQLPPENSGQFVPQQAIFVFVSNSIKNRFGRYIRYCHAL